MTNYQVADCLKAIGAFIMDNAEDVANSIDLNKTTEIKIHGSVDASGLPEVSFEQVSPVLLQQYIKKNEPSDGR